MQFVFDMMTWRNSIMENVIDNIIMMMSMKFSMMQFLNFVIAFSMIEFNDVII